MLGCRAFVLVGGFAVGLAGGFLGGSGSIGRPAGWGPAAAKTAPRAVAYATSTKRI